MPGCSGISAIILCNSLVGLRFYKTQINGLNVRSMLDNPENAIVLNRWEGN